MNVLKGKITELLSEGDIVFVKICVKGRIFSVLILVLSSLPHLEVGKEVQLLFKEHELAFLSLNSKTSVENTFKARISKLTKGKLLWELEFDFKGVKLYSIISAEQGEALGLKTGQIWLCFVKANDIILRT